MRNAIFLNMVLSSPQAELHVAHALQKKAKTGEIILIGCNQNVGACTLNPFARRVVCKECIRRRQNLVNMIKADGAGTVTVLEVPGNVPVRNTIPDSIRTGVISGIASHTRAPDEKYLSRKWTLSILTQLKANARLIAGIEKILSDWEIGNLSVFNGRFGCAASAILCAQINHIDYEVYDLNRGFNHYCFKNVSLHSVEENTRRAVKHYFADANNAEAVASKFYSDKRAGKATYEKSYTTYQKRGIISFDANKKLVAVFTSSDDEYKYIGEDWDGGTVVDQVKEIVELRRHLPSDYQVIVRMHPNQGGMPRGSIGRFYQLESNGLTIIKPEDVADSYELIELSSYVVTFCSLVGPEAAYAGKPVVSIGPSPYIRLNIGDNLSSGAEAANFIMNNEPNRDVVGSIIWANYLMTYKDELPGFVNHGDGNYSVYENKVCLSENKTTGFFIAKVEIFLAKNKLFRLRTLKLAKQRLMTFVDGKVRGEHQL